MSDETFQWPTLPGSRSDGHEGARTDRAEAAETPDAGGTWVVLVQQNTGSGEGIRWGAEQARVVNGDQAQARREALAVAETFVPRHPMMEQGRTIYRTSPDSYLVLVAGATSEFAFEVEVAQVVKRLQPEPQSWPAR